MKYLYTYRLFENKNETYIDEVVDDYIETLIFAEKPEETDLGGSDLSKSDLNKIKEENSLFIKIANQYNLLDNLDPKNQIGGDFLYSRNRHGTGFFDRDYIDKDTIKKLDKIGDLFGSVSLYLGSGGLEYDTYNITDIKRINMNDIEYFKNNLDSYTEQQLFEFLFYDNEIVPDDSYKLKKIFIEQIYLLGGALLHLDFLKNATPKVLKEFKADYPKEFEKWQLEEDLEKFNI